MTGLGSSCGACKFLRRKCTSECVFAPYFCYEKAANHFAAVHKVFGASNVSKLLLHLPVHSRSAAAMTISYEALARIRDPIYGCVAHIFELQQQVANLQAQIEILGTHMANLAAGVGSNSGISQAMKGNPCEGLQFSTQQEPLSTNYYQSQENVLNHAGDSTGNQAFDSQTNVQLPPLYGLEDPNLVCDYNSNTLETLLEGIDQDIFAHYPWLDPSSNTTNSVFPT